MSDAANPKHQLLEALGGKCALCASTTELLLHHPTLRSRDLRKAHGRDYMPAVLVEVQEASAAGTPLEWSLRCRSCTWTQAAEEGREKRRAEGTSATAGRVALWRANHRDRWEELLPHLQHVRPNSRPRDLGLMWAEKWRKDGYEVWFADRAGCNIFLYNETRFLGWLEKIEEEGKPVRYEQRGTTFEQLLTERALAWPPADLRPSQYWCNVVLL